MFLFIGLVTDLAIVDDYCLKPISLLGAALCFLSRAAETILAESFDVIPLPQEEPLEHSSPCLIIYCLLSLWSNFFDDFPFPFLFKIVDMAVAGLEFVANSLL